jgi:hypothetical protein
MTKRSNSWLCSAIDLGSRIISTPTLPFGDAVRRPTPKATLETTLGRFQSIQCIEKLKRDFSKLLRLTVCAFRRSNGEPYSIHGHSRLVCDFEFK